MLHKIFLNLASHRDICKTGLIKSHCFKISCCKYKTNATKYDKAILGDILDVSGEFNEFL